MSISKKILIISDNEFLVQSFKKIVDKLEINNFEFEYFYSSVNKHPLNLVRLGMKSLNVKDADIINNIISEYKMVFSLHSKQIFPEKLVDNITCINIHPGLNPYNRGWYPQVFSIINKKPIGATIHIMDKEIDSGEIIIQKNVIINSFDTSKDVYERVQSVEIELIEENLINILLGNYQISKPNIIGNYNGIKEFNELCALDLEKKGTLKEHLDLLRALTHGNFKNAYYYDEDEIKVFVKIELEREF